MVLIKRPKSYTGTLITDTVFSHKTKASFFLFFASQFCCEKVKWSWGWHNHLLKQEGQTLCVASSQHPHKGHPVSGVRGTRTWWDPCYIHRQIGITWKDKRKWEIEWKCREQGSHQHFVLFYVRLGQGPWGQGFFWGLALDVHQYSFF